MDKGRREWAARLAGRIAPGQNGDAFTAIMAALPRLVDLPNSVFSVSKADSIASKCSPEPTADQLRALLLDGPSASSAARTGPHPGPIPQWLYQRAMRECSGDPGPMLKAWLDYRGVDQGPDPAPPATTPYPPPEYRVPEWCFARGKIPWMAPDRSASIGDESNILRGSR